MSTFIQKTPASLTPNNSSGVSEITTTAFASNTTAGNLVVAVGHVFVNGSAPTVTFSDNKGNTWATAVTNQVEYGGDYGRIAIGYSFITTGGSGHTVTATLGSGTAYMSIAASEYNGPTSYASESTSATGSSTAASSGALSPTGNVVYAGGMAYMSASTLTLNWTGATALTTDSATSWTGSGYKIGAGSETAAWTLGTSAAWVTAIAAFREPAGGERKWILGRP